MLPPVILVLPLFALFLGAGLLNTRVGLITAHLTFNLPFLAWMLIAFFEGEVRQLEEAARIEGASRFQAFLRIAVPVAAPGILAAGLLGFILSWNEFLFALILSGRATQTLPVGLSTLETHRGRRDRAARGGDPVRGAAGVRALAVPAQISDQGSVARRAQVSTLRGDQGTTGRAVMKKLLLGDRLLAARRHRRMPRPSTSSWRACPTPASSRRCVPEFEQADRHRRRDRGRELRRDAHQAGAAAGRADRQLRRDRGRLLLGRRVHQGGLAAAARRAHQGTTSVDTSVYFDR